MLCGGADCPDGQPCRVQSSDDLRTAAESSSDGLPCNPLTIEGTSLTSVDGLDGLVSAVTIIRDNANLVDVSGLTNVSIGTAYLHGNGRLRDAEIGPVEFGLLEIIANGSRTIRIDISPVRGFSSGFLHIGERSLVELEITDEAEDRAINLLVEGVIDPSFVAQAEGVVRRLSIYSSPGIRTSDQLKGFGVPLERIALTTHEFLPMVEVGAYHEWILNNGFTNCLFVCAERIETLEPRQRGGCRPSADPLEYWAPASEDCTLFVPNDAVLVDPWANEIDAGSR